MNWIRRKKKGTCKLKSAIVKNGECDIMPQICHETYINEKAVTGKPCSKKERISFKQVFHLCPLRSGICGGYDSPFLGNPAYR